MTGPYFTYNHSSQVVAGDTCPTGNSSVSGRFLREGAPPGLLRRGDSSSPTTRATRIWVTKARKPAPGGLLESFVAPAANPVDVAEIPTGGELSMRTSTATIRRIFQFASANQPPVAVETQSDERSGAADRELRRQRLERSRRGIDHLRVGLDGDGLYDDSTAVQPTSHLYAERPARGRPGSPRLPTPARGSATSVIRPLGQRTQSAVGVPERPPDRAVLRPEPGAVARDLPRRPAPGRRTSAEGPRRTDGFPGGPSTRTRSPGRAVSLRQALSVRANCVTAKSTRRSRRNCTPPRRAARRTAAGRCGPGTAEPPPAVAAACCSAATARGNRGRARAAERPAVVRRAARRGGVRLRRGWSVWTWRSRSSAGNEGVPQRDGASRAARAVGRAAGESVLRSARSSG